MVFPSPSHSLAKPVISELLHVPILYAPIIKENYQIVQPFLSSSYSFRPSIYKIAGTTHKWN